jgi:diadenosine tetraphosphatase ApaH/serine/threonine PP2A family protein phosphatase
MSVGGNFWANFQGLIGLEDIYNHRKMERLFQLVGQYCFQGHTHVPGIFTENLQFFSPEEIDLEYTLGDGKLMINVGSVGQPRDGDNRACYAILDDGIDDSGAPNGEAIDPAATVLLPSPRKPGEAGAINGDVAAHGGGVSPRLTFRRLAYDFETTIQKIRSIPELEAFLGDRLRQGR